MQQLKQAIRDGVDFEEAVKTGRMNDQMAVELFLMKYSKQQNARFECILLYKKITSMTVLVIFEFANFNLSSIKPLR